MSYEIYRAHQRGVAEHGWLHARFSFSFAEYYDPKRMGFGVLRVLNNDTIEPGGGFGRHPHDNMEIITLVLSGELEHEDSEGNHGIIKAGEVQYMSAGEGVFHSEKNPSQTQSVELFQIWIYPNKRGGKPRYAQKSLQDIEKRGEWNIIASPDGREGSIEIRQDALFFTTKLGKGESLNLPKLEEDRGIYLMVVEGSIEIDSQRLDKRDEIQIKGTHSYHVEALEQTQLIMFDVPLELKK